MASNLLMVLISIGVFVLPGYALVSILLRDRSTGLTDRICIAVGASLAIFPLLLLGLTTMGIRSGPATVLGLIGLSLAVIVVDTIMRRRHTAPVPLRVKDSVSLEEVLLWVVFLVTLTLRLWTVQGQDYPAWTDGYHHTLISQIIHDTGLIPDSYRPYAPIDRFTYHFGFHSIVAAWTWLTGLPTPKSTLLVAQIINSLSVPTMYIFAKTLTGRKDIGLFSAVVVGLVSIMPAYYVNWSRNTQLAGHVILAVALAVLVQVIESPAEHRRWGVLGAILLAGLFLMHYAVLAFVVVFMAVYVAAWVVQDRHNLRQQWQRLAWLAGCAVGGGLLISPWAWHTVSAYLLPKHLQATAVPLLSAEERRQVIAIYFAPMPLAWLLTQVIRPLQAVLAYLGTLVGMISHRRVILVLVIWFGLLFILATPAWTGLPYRLALYNNFSVAIALYLVFSVFIAILASYVIDRISHRWRAMRPALSIIAVISACAMAYQWQPRVLDPNQEYVTHADEAAARWIADNLPDGAMLAIRPYFPTPVEVIGVDGGYWLPYLSGRQVTIPPMIYYAEGERSYISEVLAFSKAVLNAQSVEALADLLKSRSISYVYIGPRAPDMRRQILADSPQFETIYNEDGVTIFHLR